MVIQCARMHTIVFYALGFVVVEYNLPEQPPGQDPAEARPLDGRAKAGLRSRGYSGRLFKTRPETPGETMVQIPVACSQGCDGTQNIPCTRMHQERQACMTVSLSLHHVFKSKSRTSSLVVLASLYAAGISASITPQKQANKIQKNDIGLDTLLHAHMQSQSQCLMPFTTQDP